MKNLPLTIASSLLASLLAVGQQSPPLTPVKFANYANAKPARCEYRTAVLDGIHQKTPADEQIIVVARLGDGETRANLSWRRLRNVRAYWSEYLDEGGNGYRRDPETILLAEGERVKGYGQLEFYVGGKLVDVLKAAHDSDIDFGDCYPPDDSYIRRGVYDRCRVKSHRVFYPCRDARKR